VGLDSKSAWVLKSRNEIINLIDVIIIVPCLSGSDRDMLNPEDLKKKAGVRAVDFVEDGMIVGLGTGSTVYYSILELDRRIREDGLNIVGIPTSVSTENLAKELGIPLGDLEEHPVIDLTIDGADEVSPGLDLIKGLGGALLREKIVAKNTRTEIIVVDEGKLVDKLGTRSPLPVEVVPFGHSTLKGRFYDLDARPVLRKDRKDTGKIFITDSDNYIFDLHFEKIRDPVGVEMQLNNLPGVIENGLFLGLTAKVVVAGSNGIEIIEK